MNDRICVVRIPNVSSVASMCKFDGFLSHSSSSKHIDHWDLDLYSFTLVYGCSGRSHLKEPFPDIKLGMSISQYISEKHWSYIWWSTNIYPLITFLIFRKDSCIFGSLNPVPYPFVARRYVSMCFTTYFMLLLIL